MSATQCCEQCGARLPPRAPGGLCPKCLLAQAVGAPADAWVADEIPSSRAETPIADFSARRFGDYELLEKVAEGGMGVVYRARQLSLNRIVAVKMIQPGRVGSPEMVLRFRAEAEAAASLHHPNIVTIHETGECEGQHYFSMDYIEGKNLAETVRDGPLPSVRTAQLVAKIAAAIHHAHQHRILHRDLKPSNVILDDVGEPQVTDFGLARRLGGDSTLTLTGQVFGSPRFMPPEQASGRPDAVGVHSDVYGLGAILYYLLTARPPFVGETVETTLAQVLEQEPVPPRLLNASIPRDLETICLKCLEKEPSRRYATAQVVADELDRFLRSEPILARPVGVAGKTWRWCRRKPVIAGLSGALSLALVLGFTAVLKQWRETQRANVAAERREYAANIALVQSLIADQEIGRAREILDIRTPERYRSWEWGWLQRQCNQDLMTLSGAGPAEACYFAVFDPTARILATDGGNLTKTVLLWDFATGQKLRTLVGHSAWVVSGAFSRDGRQLATSSAWDRVARIWDVATGREWRQLEHPDGVSHVAYSPDGKRLVTTCWDGIVRVWDTERWTVVDKSPEYGDHVYCAEFSPDGRRIAYAGGHFWWTNSRVTSVRIWDLDSREVRSLEGHTRCVFGVAWNPKGDLLASCAWDGQVILWDVASRLPLARMEPGARPRVLCNLSFSPDGQSLAIAGTEFPAHPYAPVLEVPTLRVRYDLAGHSKNVHGLAFSHDGHYIATAAADGMVKVWPAEPLPPYLSLEGHDQPVWAVAFSPNGDYVATGSLDQTARIWDARSGALLQNLNVSFPVVSLAFSHGGERIVTVGPDNTACVWQVEASHEADDSPPGFGVRQSSAALVAGPSEREAAEKAPEDWRTPRRLQGHTATVMAVAWSPDDRWLLTASKDKSARIWDVRTGALQVSLDGHNDSVLAVAFSPQGKVVATGSADDSIRLWDARSGQCLRTLTNHQADVLSLAFSPNGKLLASGGDDRKARLWDVQSGRQLHELSASVEGVTSVAFSPNGTRLATANSGTSLYTLLNRESRIRLWDVSLGLELFNFVAHTNTVYGVAFSPDGQRFATGSGDNTARIWTAFPWRSVDYPGEPELSLSARIENYKRQFFRGAIETHRRGQNLRTEPQLPRHTGVHFVGSFNLPPAGSKTSPRRPIPLRSPLAGPDQLDLTASYNVALNESWQPVQSLHEVDLSLAALPSGLQTLAGVRFDVRGLIQLRRGAVDCELFPERVAIPVRRRFTQLHALHGGRWEEQKGTSVATLVLHYVDGTEATLPIIYGEHLRVTIWGRDWGPDCPLGQVVWPSPVPADPKDIQPWLYKATFTNPRPALEVERLEYVSQVGRCGPFLVALSVE